MGSFKSLEAIKNLNKFKLLGLVMQAPCALYDQLLIDKLIYFVENISIFYSCPRLSRGYINEVD